MKQTKTHYIPAEDYMQNFHQWLETNHPELNENLWHKVALGGALALGAAAPDYAQAAEPQPAATAQNQVKQNRENRRMWKTPLIAAAMGAAAAARAAKRKQQ